MFVGSLKVDLQNWLVIFTKRDQPRASDFINCMKEVCPKMGIHVGQPIICTIQDDRTQTYLTKIRNTINPQVRNAGIPDQSPLEGGGEGEKDGG